MVHVTKNLHAVEVTRAAVEAEILQNGIGSHT